LKLVVKERKAIGTNKVKHLRRKEWIPAVIYGHGEKSYHIKVKKEDFLDLIHSLHSEAVLITLDYEGKELPVLIKEVIRDPLTEGLIHVDFQHIHEDEEVAVHVLLEFKGEAKGIEEGGVLDIEHRYLTVRCLPKDIPEEIIVDISDLEIGDSIHIRDLELPEHVEIEEGLSTTIVNVLSPRKIVEVEAVEEGLLVGEEMEEPEIVSEEEKTEEEEKPKEESGK